MRATILITLLLLFVGCGVKTDVASIDKTIVGPWKLMTMAKTPVELEKVVESDLLHGSMNFKADNTFDGEAIYPKKPEYNMKFQGTYSLEGDIITIANQANNSTTKSKVRFEKDFLIITPLDPAGLISYLKRRG